MCVCVCVWNSIYMRGVFVWEKNKIVCVYMYVLIQRHVHIFPISTMP